MTPLEPYYQRQLAEAMAGVGRRTDVALLAVLARRADDYAYFPLFWSAVLALALPGLLHGVLGWPSVRGLIVANVLLFVGLCVLFSYALVLWAMHLGSVAEAAALRELSVILVVLLGMRYLKEPFGGPRLLACGLVLAGMLVMKL